MVDYDSTIEEFEKFYRDRFNKLIHYLNDEDRWKNVYIKLEFYRNPVHFSSRSFKNMTSSPSPSLTLLNELSARFCSVGQLMEILKESDLFDATLILTGEDALEIIEEPGENDQLFCINYGGELTLVCRAKGQPPLSYQWYKFNEPLIGFNSPELSIKDFSENDVGEYYCIVSHLNGGKFIELFSNVAVCQLIGPCPEFIKEPPNNLIVSVGTNVEFQVEVLHPSQCKLQWFKGNAELKNETLNILKIYNVQKENIGKYRCVASNSVGEVFSNPCNLEIQDDGPTNQANAKAALLIGNEKYDHHTNLRSSCNDVVCLENILKKLDFHVITLINLTLVEMQNAIYWFFNLLVPEKSYVFIYYVGHGFQISNNKFMMPVDCPNSGKFKLSDCICEQLLIQVAMKKKPEFLVVIFDMCLKVPKRNENPEIFTELVPNYKYTRDPSCNIVKAFATSSHQRAYEKPENYHSIYMDYLSKHLSYDKPLVEILQIAHSEFSKDKVGEKQTPCVSFDDRKHCKLTDPVLRNHKLEVRMAIVSKIKCTKHLLEFNQINLSANVFVKPHRGCILNAVDLIFDKKLSQWHVTANVVPEELFATQWTLGEDGDSVLTLCNVQKVKSDVCITVHISSKEDSNASLGFATLEIGIPLIAAAKLWYCKDQDQEVKDT